MNIEIVVSRLKHQADITKRLMEFGMDLLVMLKLA